MRYKVSKIEKALIRFLKEKGAYQEFVKNIRTHHKTKARCNNETIYNIYRREYKGAPPYTMSYNAFIGRAIDYLLVWIHTPSGHSYWLNLHREWLSLWTKITEHGKKREK